MDPASSPSRRALLRWMAAGAAGTLAACRAGDLARDVAKTSAAVAAKPQEVPMPPPPSSSSRMPAVFVGHGSPMTVLDRVKGPEMARATAGLRRPDAILVVSAHFEVAPPSLGAVEPIPLVYDFYGFPDEMYQVRYPSPGAPTLANRVAALLGGESKVRRDPERGLDHGAWCPLAWLYPKADVPVLELSLPTDDPRRLFEMGRALAPLRDENVLILGSGNIVHNLRRTGSDATPTPAWASDFDAWTAATLSARRYDALVDWRKQAPAPSMAHPTDEHWNPLLVVAGAAADGGAVPTYPLTGFEGASISRRCVRIG